MESVLLWAALLAGVVVLTPLADRLRVPLPVLLTIFGLALPLLPFVPNLRIDPDLILPVVLPPLLFAATQRSTAHEFRSNARPILLLAVFLTLASAGLVAVLAHAAGLPWGMAFVLGAIVAPPDPVAATAVARRLRLPGRVVTVLEGEGMFNDATALVLYNVAVAAVVTGEISAGRVGLDLLLGVVGGVVVGLVAGWLGHRALGHLHDPFPETLVTLALPFAAYLIAEELHGSGVLAVLTLGLLLRSVSHTSVTSGGWLLGRSVWEFLDYVITGIVFVLIGFELTYVIEHSPVAGSALPLALGVVGALIVLRLVWVWVSVLVVRRVTARRDLPDTFTNRETAVVSWAGMRGVVSVAAALALPLVTDDGGLVADRDKVVFVALVTVLATLVLQGLTLAPLVQRLHVGSTVDEAHEIAALRERASRAALDSVRADSTYPQAVRDAVAHQYEGYLSAQQALADARSAGGDEDLGVKVDELLRLANEVERTLVIRERNHGQVSPEVADEVLQDVEARAVRDLD
ncbi:Na+/H+ antiporter [Cellulomonas sp. PhB143]|uniref:Na+/H+ antiporter n=1 Tax=Cellulomonas sp. PhB143 TaxID=2485186 RepID=UPI000F49777D|nr:Na+/H+ antiporter [Cellulomonas sp. PhB143]ROS76675.1 CPA1 family monovalent cation:H+ antiporter [Cellulomonas sp. PhB143]